MQINQINHSYKELDELIRSLWNEKNKRKSLNIGINLANEVMRLMGIPEDELEIGDAVLDRAFSNARFKNQKMENWFEKHPYFGNGRVALKHYNKNTYPVESNLYQLNESATKARISAVSQLSTNWEDSELTMLPDYNVGLDFFLNSKADSLLVVVSKEGNLRVLELSEKLSKTQIEIFKKLDKCFHYTGIDPKTGERIKYEPQRTIHQTIWNALELKEVNKQFYLGIANQFELLIQYLKQNVPEGLENENIDHSARLFSSRLIGRIIFIWFLRKKNIINEKIEYFNTDKLNGTQYYEQKLKPLFFQTLNTPIDKRTTEDKLTPYLNGGLFEAHKNDWAEYKVNFPVDWFNKLYDHLNSFNFTTDESSPEYEMIAIDPEMLGRVFENLLASIVPETEKAANERNNKGAFYTPREIVTFMCKESLKQYIKTKLDNPKDNQGVDRLIDMNDAQFLEHRSTGMSELWGNRTTEVKKKIIEALNNFKMLDPACGSGAFPMGMLHLLVKTFDRLTAVYDKQIDKHRSAKANEKINVYDTKLFIINKMLYGSDIEPMAIEISRLRAWLSLIIDTEKANNVEPLPNLEFNFVCSNSLIPLKVNYQTSLFEDRDFEEKFNVIKDKFFKAYTLKQKHKIKEEFKELYKTKVKGSEESKRVKQLKSWDPFETDKPADFFDSKIMFSVESFDSIIGNPP
ncbi:MAG: Eco57I restriction-modification methylase domain-containing protein, partial [bacterium]